MEVDSEYFTSYENLEIHELMLRDEPRNEAYRSAIMGNKSAFKVSSIIDLPVSIHANIYTLHYSFHQ